ncbi:TOBE domain-containing protein [Salipiger thiooxidans]|uniref:TOBE domain-containing protein n=1 Tax=Salipiger thiooxidans TaxID=282683 RepID=UPI001CD1AC14|nr:TOBE domain-containing protein [Salipiger thiooxidans]MCA0846253.1 TOBE domain-containing protein [Salipiger thiooxidans]
MRPEQIRQGDGAESRVIRVEHLGDKTRLLLSFRDHALISVTDAHTALRSGDTVRITHEAPFFFNASGARVH